MWCVMPEILGGVMICFEVSLNGERLYLAGIGEAGVLTAILSLGANAAPDKEGGAGETG